METATEPPRRPWYLLAAMLVVWILAAGGAARAFSEVDYLRGNAEPLHKLDTHLREAEGPATRLELLHERTKLEAMGEFRDAALPTSIARAVLFFFLMLGASGVAFGRPSGRSLATQALIANLAMAAIAFVVLSDVRHRTHQEVERLAPEALPSLVAQMSEDEVTATFELHRQRDALELALESTLYMAALASLFLRRSRTYFAGLERREEAPREDPGVDP